MPQRMYQGSHFLENHRNVRAFCFDWNVRELSGNFAVCQGFFWDSDGCDSAYTIGSSIHVAFDGVPFVDASINKKS